MHASRLAAYLEQQADNTWVGPDRINLIVYIYRLGELLAMVNRLFPFARSLDVLDSSKLTWDDFENAYRNLDLWIEEIHIDDNNNLEAFTKRAVERIDSMDTQQAP